jgi:hypothetical protein
MSFDLLRHDLNSDEEVAVIEQTRLAVEQKSRIEEQLEQDAGRLVAHGDYLQQRIASARNLNRYVTTEDLQSYVSDFIDSHCEGAQLVRGSGADSLIWELDLGPITRSLFADYLEKERLYGKSRLATPAFGRQSCIFENVLKRSQDDAEIISQYHPLIGYIRKKLELKDQNRVAVVVAMRLGKSQFQSIGPGTYVFAVSRWSISGEQDVDRLVFDGKNLETGEFLEGEDAERFVSVAAMNGQPWQAAVGQLDGLKVGDVFESLIERLDQRYQEYVARAQRENRDRVSFQFDQVDKQEAREVQRLENLIWLLRMDNKLRTIKANEGRLYKVRERAAERRSRLKGRQELRHESILVCAGVARVE